MAVCSTTPRPPPSPSGPADPLRARVLAATFLTALRVSGQTAFDDPHADYADLIRRAFAIVRENFTE